MKKIIVFGTCFSVIKRVLFLKLNFEIVAYIGKEEGDGKKIKQVFGEQVDEITYIDIPKYEYDYILWIGNNYDEIMYKLIIELQISNKKIQSLDVVFTRWWGKTIHSFGEENPNKVFYVISRGINESVAGLFCFFNDFLLEYRYALEQGYIPVLDMQNFYTNYSEISEFGKINIWEKFFLQTNNIDLNEVYRSKNVMFAKSRSLLHQPDPFPIERAYFEETVRKYWNSVYKESLIPSKDISQSVDEEFGRMMQFAGNKKVIGISIRGVDHTRRKPFLHYVAPTYPDLINQLKILMDEWNMEFLYVNADENALIDELEMAFPGKIFFTERKRYDSYADDLDKTGVKSFSKDKPEWVTQIRFKRENDAYLRGKEYLVSTMLLAKCNAIVYSGCSSTLGALITSENFERKYFYDLGLYGFEENSYSLTPVRRDIIVNDNPESIDRLAYLNEWSEG
ncbi:MAG: hypothetical protein PHX08_04085 [Lachnospiraceae bacterium]|nr:hypothetical protein [Lachnospiraceae bacterium]